MFKHMLYGAVVMAAVSSVSSIAMEKSSLEEKQKIIIANNNYNGNNNYNHGFYCHFCAGIPYSDRYQAYMPWSVAHVVCWKSRHLSGCYGEGPHL